ncbi:MAG TPA: hemolysin III family protein [Luteolibacter sp.]|nr:hemolysin III family protein [Luteolibacter sp.]
MPDPESHRSHLCESHREEIASMLTHAAGLLFSIAALVTMLVLANGSVVKLACALVFGVSLVMLYASSTLYHYSTTPRWKARMQALDHACIYLLIAGSYTPFMLVTLRGPLGWSLLAVVWAMALAGILMKTIRNGRKDHWISTAFYLIMGWMVLFAIVPMWRAMQAGGMAWLVAGGFCYTLGVVFFAWRRLPYNHAVWHLFVLAGSACHVLAACLFVF